jgi:hypothetical protein
MIKLCQTENRPNYQEDEIDIEEDGDGERHGKFKI